MGIKNREINYWEAKTADEGSEKHVPLIQTQGNLVCVRVGSIPHPMEKDHFIEWIELQTNYEIYRKYLAPGDSPEVTFVLGSDERIMDVYAYCNVHGLWLKSLPRYLKTSSCMGEVVHWK